MEMMMAHSVNAILYYRLGLAKKWVFSWANKIKKKSDIENNFK